MDIERTALIAGVILFIAAMVYIWFFRKDQFTAYRMCDCESGFTPNPHDGRCAVCRGWER